MPGCGSIWKSSQRCSYCRHSSFDALCGVELGEAYDDSDGPALYIYYAQQGERIFDIAKRYHARARDLAAANHLESSEPTRETTADAACLLIPAAL